MSKLVHFPGQAAQELAHILEYRGHGGASASDVEQALVEAAQRTSFADCKACGVSSRLRMGLCFKCFIAGWEPTPEPEIP